MKKTFVLVVFISLGSSVRVSPGNAAASLRTVSYQETQTSIKPTEIELACLEKFVKEPLSIEEMLDYMEKHYEYIERLAYLFFAHNQFNSFCAPYFFWKDGQLLEKVEDYREQFPQVVAYLFKNRPIIKDNIRKLSEAFVNGNSAEAQRLLNCGVATYLSFSGTNFCLWFKNVAWLRLLPKRFSSSEYSVNGVQLGYPLYDSEEPVIDNDCEIIEPDSEQRLAKKQEFREKLKKLYALASLRTVSHTGTQPQIKLTETELVCLEEFIKGSFSFEDMLAYMEEHYSYIPRLAYLFFTHKNFNNPSAELGHERSKHLAEQARGYEKQFPQAVAYIIENQQNIHTNIYRLTNALYTGNTALARKLLDRGVALHFSFYNSHYTSCYLWFKNADWVELLPKDFESCHFYFNGGSCGGSGYYNPYLPVRDESDCSIIMPDSEEYKVGLQQWKEDLEKLDVLMRNEGKE